MTEGISFSSIGAWEKDFEENASNATVETLLSNAKCNISETLKNRQVVAANAHVFNHKITEVTPVTAQEDSGRCWLFATLNCARLAFGKKYSTEDFEFSAPYLYFWSRLEKANTYLENVLRHIDEGLDSKYLEHYNKGLVSDGGTWQSAARIIGKYGLVPKALYGETHASRNSEELGRLLASKLREFGLELRDMHAGNNQGVSLLKAHQSYRKGQMLYEIYTMLRCVLGSPPHRDSDMEISWYDKDKKYCSLKMSPVGFYEHLSPEFSLDNYVQLANDPTVDISKCYEVPECICHIGGTKPPRWYNTEMQVIETAIVKMIKDERAVYVALQDASPARSSDSGVWDTALHDYTSVLGFGFSMSKANRLMTHDIRPFHAMALVGVHTDDNDEPVRYRLENSWSDKAGVKGYYVASKDWFREYGFTAVVHRSCLPQNVLERYDQQEAVELPPWHYVW